ncbi:uncharacterized protein LOC110028740 [Phalaenopsis equestris]|uniref:uncharacterized protein LOC110028740 n=1 Tax=Phalaenopsis equestris TaxID=78828 RepID=UPI0009E52517|nr:uncharacterized protein LOC110028740 [Phalaenopsis equestris]
MNKNFIRKSLSLLSIRAYTAQAAKRTRTAQIKSSPIKLTAEAILNAAGDEKEQTNFWMRDPKTGNWMPQNKINTEEADPAFLRAKFLPSSNK